MCNIYIFKVITMNNVPLSFFVVKAEMRYGIREIKGPQCIEKRKDSLVWSGVSDTIEAVSVCRVSNVSDHQSAKSLICQPRLKLLAAASTIFVL